MTNELQKRDPISFDEALKRMLKAPPEKQEKGKKDKPQDKKPPK